MVILVPLEVFFEPVLTNRVSEDNKESAHFVSNLVRLFQYTRTSVLALEDRPLEGDVVEFGCVVLENAADGIGVETG